jgi:KDO2-lipid IV(A) lauroyltransferase
VLCLIAWLPFRLRMATGTLLGLATYMAARERRYITGINIALCFPELDAAAQAALVRRCFIDNGIGLIETATGWVRPPSHFLAQVKLSGTQYLDAALATGRGVLMLGAHYSTLDFGANLLSMHYPFAVTYRAHKNPLFDAFMLRGRLRNCNGVFDRKDIRGAFRHLKQNKILWYAPDQDYGPEQAVFVPFFGQIAATITAASRFAGFNASPVVLVRQHRDNRRKLYELDFIPLTPPLPSGDDTFDATYINVAVERAIRMEPSQYLWMHKRFKTQRGGKPDSPYIHIKTPDKKLGEEQYAGLLSGAEPLAGTDFVQLGNGLSLLEFPGLERGLFRQRHPALQLDRLSKDLRSAGLRTLTTDNLFRVPSRGLTAVTCFLPPGVPLPQRSVTPDIAAAFLARLHNHGFYFNNLEAGDLVVADKGLGILNPLTVRKVPGSASHRQRMRDLRAWCRITNSGTLALSVLLALYLPQVRPTDAEGFRLWLAQLPALADNAPAPADTNSSRPQQHRPH